MQVLSSIVDQGMEPWDAVAIPRLHHQLIPNVVAIDKALGKNIVDELLQRKHVVGTLVFLTFFVAVAGCSAPGGRCTVEGFPLMVAVGEFHGDICCMYG